MNLYLIRSIPVDTDSRSLRYYNLFIGLGMNVVPVVWGATSVIGAVSCPIPRIRDNKYLNSILTPVFMLWLFFYILKNFKKNDLVFAVDLDCGLPVCISRIFKRFDYIYDIADPYSICRFNKRIDVVDTIESWVASKSSLAIVPSKDRANLYKCKFNAIEIENVPSNTGRYSPINLHVPIIRFGYFGMLEPEHRGLEVIAAAILSTDNAVLHVGGTGGLDSYFRNLANEYPDKIKYFGSYHPDELHNLTDNVDVLFAFYSLSKIHHCFVAANKTYEHLQFGRPVITNEGTSLSNSVIRWNSGWVVEESVDAICLLLKTLVQEPTVIIKYGEVARKYWENNYMNYWGDNNNVRRLVEAAKHEF